MDLGLAESRALVTGSSRGIGFGIATAFLAEGAKVVLTGRNEDSLKSACDQLAAQFDGSSIHAFPGDLRDQGTRQSLIKDLTCEGLNHLVCNIGSGRSVPVFQETEDEWQRMLNINLTQAANMVRDLRPLLVESARQGQNSSVTFVGSICGLEAIGCPVAYASAKAALLAYAKNLVRPLAADGVRVNTVTPGNVIFAGSTWETKLAQDRTAVQVMLDHEVPLKRLGSVDEIAAAIVFAASGRASFMTGANLVVDGGQTRGV